jgi:hypothetical protein
LVVADKALATHFSGKFSRKNFHPDPRAMNLKKKPGKK